MSHFCCSDPLHKIEKAKKRPAWHKTINPKRVEALSHTVGRAVKVDLIKGITTFRKRINPEKIYHAWLNSSYEGIMRALPWEKLPTDLAPAKAGLLEGMIQFAKIGVESIPKPVRSELRYDLKNPAIQKVLDKRTGSIIEGVTKDTQANIQRIVSQQMNKGVSPRDMAEDIKNYVGLYPRLAQAHQNYIDGLREDGASEDRVSIMGDKYYDKLLDYRAETIARTETQSLLNRGQDEVWKEGARQGLIPSASTRVWQTDGNPCEICEPMDGVEVGLYEPWVLDDGSEVDVPSDTHPNCECLMTLNIPDGGEDEE